MKSPRLPAPAAARPGPTALQIVSAINQIQSMITRRQTGDANPAQVWLEMPEQQVPFKLDQGRMYNDGLTFLVKNVSVKTSGSVGLDETLNLVAEIGIRDEWLGNNKILASLKGQSISIPIIGTLNHPQIDSRVFASLAQKLGSSAFEGILQDKVGDKLNNLDGALNKGLDKLFGGKK